MKLTLTRKWLDDICTVGILKVNEQPFCFTLELPVVDDEPGSAIPEGTYGITLTHSPKFNQDMPLLSGIPGRSEIRIHWGNVAANTQGCILVGETAGQDFVGNSRAAFGRLFPLIQSALQAGELISITIEGEKPASLIASRTNEPVILGH
jgi:hypothetical protein